MTHGSLFSGIGGFDLAAEWMGWQNVFHCEWNEFGQKVLKYYWPNAISYNDITKTDFTIHRGRIDILTGGFPCQPYSMAGKRLGKEDDRHLWPEMLRAIREIQPRWVVGENVLGLVNWSDGLVFHEVQADLEAEGYEVQPYVLPAVSVNAPHRRDRVWFVAHANGCRMQESILQHTDISARPIRNNKKTIENTVRNGRLCGQSNKEGAEVWEQRDISAGDTERICGTKMAGIATNTDSSTTGTPRESRGIKGNGSANNVQQSERGSEAEQHNRSFAFSWDVTYSDSNGQYRSNCKHEEQSGKGREYAQRHLGASDDDGDASDTDSERLQCKRQPAGMGRQRFGINNTQGNEPNWQNFPSVSPVCHGDDGISDRLDGVTFSKWRQESIKAGGNAVVPQVVLQIFRTIEEYEKMNAQ